jgi:hypothetical protein
LAWLNAAPDASNGGDGVSRLEFYTARDLPVITPECDASYILDYLFELGVSVNGEALTHSEIRNWQENTGIELQSFEARTLKRLSRAYLEESSKAKNIDAETAWSDAPGYMCAGYIKAMRTKESIRKMADI